MYPLQLLTGIVLLAAILGMPDTTLQLATAGRELTSTASPPTVSDMPAPPSRIKWQCHSSDWEVTMPRPEEEEAVGLDITPEEWPCQRQKDGKHPVRLLKESCHKSSGKTLKLSDQLGGHISKHTTLTMTMKGPMTSPMPSRRWPPLLGSDIHEVQQVWTGQKDLQVAHCVAKSSPKDIHFFQVVPLTELPKIMGLKGIHSPKALRWQSGLSFCP